MASGVSKGQLLDTAEKIINAIRTKPQSDSSTMELQANMILNQLEKNNQLVSDPYIDNERSREDCVTQEDDDT